MKKFLSMLAIAAMVTSFIACDDDDDNDDPGNENTAEVISGVITSNQTWTADVIYELDGRVIVADGVTLTIEPGTIIKGHEGQGADASVLMVARGGKINAVGTAAKPIIMTTILDNIEVGQTAGTNLTEDDRGKWGGLVLLGKAPISVANGTEAQIEGVPAGEPLGLYGGEVANDNSGTLRYVSIRHGGTVISTSSEINGLTLGGVGSGTTISDIEIFGNVDDGVEFFGGTVDVSNILIAYQGDDGIDIDMAYSGTVDGFMVLHGGDTDKGLEIDGPEGAANATGKFTLSNGTVKSDPSKPGDASDLGDFKSKAQGTLENVVFTGYTEGKSISIAASFNKDDCSAGTSNAYSNLIADELVFSTVQFTGFGVNVYSGTKECPNVPADYQPAAQEKIQSTQATGGPAIATWSWTLSESRSLLD